MASAKVILYKSKKKSDGSSPLALRVIKNRRSRYIFLGHYLQEKDWNEELARVRKSHPNSQRLNNLILKKIAEADDILIESDVQKKNLTSEQVKAMMKGGRSKSFFQLAEEYRTDMIKSGKHSIAKSDKSRVENFRKFLNGEDIFFHDITDPLLKKFKVYLKSTFNHSERTVINHYITIRTLFNRAIKEGGVDSKYYPFGRGNISIKRPDSLKVGLTKEEIEKIESLDLKPGSPTWHTRNIFLFSFYLAGVRISDVVRMKWSDLKGDRIFYKMGKNDKAVSIKIPGKINEMIKYYRSKNQNTAGYIFPELKTAQQNNSEDLARKINSATKKFNTHLKKIKELASIDKKITNHISRHSFGNIAGDKIPVQMLQKLYRHSNIQTTIGYQANFMFKDADDALDAVINF